MLTSFSGFSIADSAQAASEAEDLERRARIELFQKGERDHDLYEACSELLAELQAKP